MDNHLLSLIIDKHEKMDAKIDSISVVLATNTAHLNEHMRRTELLEARSDKYSEELNKVSEAMRLPGFLIKLSSAISIVVGIVLAVKQLL